MTLPPIIHSPPGHILFRLWRGEERLWKAYWLLGVLGGWAVSTIVINLEGLEIIPPLAALLLIGLYSLYVAIIIWRCAYNCDWIWWGYAARFILVLSALFLAQQIFIAINTSGSQDIVR